MSDLRWTDNNGTEHHYTWTGSEWLYFTTTAPNSR